MDPEIIKQLARGAIPPGMFSVIALALLWWSGRTKKIAPGEAGGAALNPHAAAPPSRRAWAHPLLFAAAYIPTHVFVLGLTWPPATASDWLVITAACAAIASLALVAPRLPAVARWGVLALLLAAVGWASSANLIARSWGAGRTALTLAAFTLVGLGATSALTQLVRDRRGPIAVIHLFLPVFTASQLLVLAYYSLRLSQAAGIVTALLGGMLVVAIWRRRLMPGGPAAAWTMILTWTFLYQGALYGDAKHALLHPLLVAASPVAALSVRRLAPPRLAPLPRTLVELAAAALPLAAAMAFAVAGRTPAGEY